MLEDYQKARKLGEKSYRRAVSAGKYPYLPALEEIVTGIDSMQEVSAGLAEIPLSMVVGTRTAGRQNAFACNFMPLLADQSEFAYKWSALYDSQIEEGIRDPILVYEYMNYFYVREGNKRVSVMKYVDSPLIAANVTRILPKDDGSASYRIYQEFLQFFKLTRIYPITFSKEGCYKELASMIGEDLENPWQLKSISRLKSAFDLFQTVYRAKGGEYLPGTFGDAFLLYLKVYGFKSFQEDGMGAVKTKTDKLWKEFMAASSGQSVEVVEEPSEVKLGLAASQVNTLKSILNLQGGYTKEDPLRIAFLHEKTSENSSWIYGHELGRRELEDHFGGIVETHCIENLDTPEKTDKALEGAAADNEGLVFTTSPSMMEASLRAAIKYPELRVMNCSVNLSVNAVRTYYARLYEAKFMIGALAASLAEDHTLGYIADYPIYGCIANINAFALGAALVDPQCRIHLAWKTKEGADPVKELREKGIQIVSGEDLINPSEEDRYYGLYREKDGQLTRLAMPVIHWGQYYILLVNKLLEGSYDASPAKKGQALNYWWGMNSGVVDVILSNQLSGHSKRLMELLRRDIVDKRLLPFAGPLLSQKGEIPADPAVGLTKEAIIEMDWLCENVIGEIPSAGSLKQSAQKTVRVSGVGEAKSV